MADDVIYLAAAFLTGCLFCLVIVFVVESVKKHRRAKDDIIINDYDFDPNNRINQRERYWKPFEVDGTVLYKLQ